MAVVSVPGIELHLVKPVPLPPRFVWLHTPLRWVLSSWRYDGLGGGVTEERNHGMVWVGSSLEGYVVPTPLPWSGNLPPDQVTGSPHPTWPWTPLALWSLTTTLSLNLGEEGFPCSSPAAQEGPAAMQRGVFVWITSGACRLLGGCLSMCQGTSGICFCNIPVDATEDWGADYIPPWETPSLPTGGRWIQPESTVLALPFFKYTAFC